MRAFLAIDIPEIVRQELTLLLGDLKKCGVPVRWTLPRNLHLTLKFLGEIEIKQAEQVAVLTSRLCENQKPFGLRLAGLGAFPDLNRPRVVWVGVERSGSDRLVSLVEKIESELQAVEFKRGDPPFSAHLTLGRVKADGPPLRKLTAVVRSNEFSSAYAFDVNQITFYKSTLHPAGAIYEPIQFFPLGES